VTEISKAPSGCKTQEESNTKSSGNRSNGTKSRSCGFLPCPTADEKFEYKKQLGQVQDIAKKYRPAHYPKRMHTLHLNKGTIKDLLSVWPHEVHLETIDEDWLNN
jgi:hypothetical protein